MALICFASQKGSPGTTLTALLTAATWPTDTGRRVLLVEADADGGCLALRYGLGRSPGLVSLAAAGRHGLTRDELWAHAQQLPGGLAVIVAPERADRAASILTAHARSVASWLKSLPDVDVIVDAGRIGPGSSALAFAEQADATLIVARPRAEQIHPAAERAQTAARTCGSVGWVLIGDRPHGPAEVAEVTGIEVAAVLPDDARTATAVTAGGPSMRLRKTPLVRAAADLAQRLARQLHETPTSATTVMAAEVERTAMEQVVA